METKKFAVVYLPSEKIYSEVPVSWFSDDNTQCWWPKSVNATTYMIRGELPNKSTWELHDIEIETYCSTLESARRKAEDPSYLTSEEGLEVTGRGRRKKKTIIRSTSEGSITPTPLPSALHSKQKRNIHQTKKNRCRSTSTESSITPPPSPPSKNTAIIKNNSEQYFPAQQVETVQEIPDPEHAHGIIDDNFNIENVPIVIAENTRMEDLQFSIDHLTRICLDVQKSLQSMHKTMKSLCFQHGKLEVDNYLKHLQENLPLKTVEEISSFDNDLREDEKKHSFVSYMRSIGGRDLKDHINRCLGIIYTNSLARNCSLHGKRGNLKLGETYAMKLFIDVMVTHHKTSHSEVESQVSEWFRLAKQRFNRAELKNIT